MKKTLFTLLALILVLATCTCQAAEYTLPEKMHNQLAIGSGLKGTFSISSEGEMFNIPFLKDIFDTRFLRTVSDAEYNLRGILSGKDLHYYVFQSDEQDQQKALSELYRKDGIYYFRSDMVQGKILEFPVKSAYIEQFIPSGGENVSPASFISNMMTVSEQDRKEQWDPVLTRYQNELEIWLAGFAVEAETVKTENGSSALDFSYEIPMEEVNRQIVALFAEFSTDPDINTLLDSVMTQEEKALYVNENLLYYYKEALNSFDMDKKLTMKKRVSAMGEVLSFGIELPLDEKSTGYDALRIESVSGLNVYTLQNQKEVIVFGIPDQKNEQDTSYEKSIWLAKVYTDPSEKGLEENFSLRIDLKKAISVYKKGEGDDEKNHEEDQYDISLEKDLTYLPEDINPESIPEFTPVKAGINLHYSSKYAQNVATTLEVQASFIQGESTLAFTGKFKTAVPWVFMPFEIQDPIQVGTEKEKEIIPYLTDWVSNAASMISHISAEEPVQEENTDDVPENAQNETGESESAETAPLEVEEAE